jgi:hypothetical protein
VRSCPETTASPWCLSMARKGLDWGIDWGIDWAYQYSPPPSM